MRLHQVTARDLPDLWFQAVHDILDHGRRFVIDRGSYAGQTRLEYDFFTGHVSYPGTQPLIPDIPPSCGIPNPVEHDYIYGGPGYSRAYIEYLMSSRKEPGESYTYGERLTRVPITDEKLGWWQEGNTTSPVSILASSSSTVRGAPAGWVLSSSGRIQTAALATPMREVATGRRLDYSGLRGHRRPIHGVPQCRGS